MSARKKEKLEQVSHKVIEKRRRDRINNCLAELSQAVPAAFAKQSSGKLEKAEILEMTVEYLRAINALGQKLDDVDWLNPLFYTELHRHYAVGYGECVREVLRYVTEVEGLNATDGRCVRMMTYLQHRLGPQIGSGEDIVDTDQGRGSPPAFQDIFNQRTSNNSNLQTPAFSAGRHKTLNHHQVGAGSTMDSVSPESTTTSALLHGSSRWSSHCFACHGPNFNRKSTSNASATTVIAGIDHTPDYLGLQFISKMATTNASACLTPSSFYNHNNHPSDIFYHSNTSDFTKWAKPTH